MTPNRSQTAPTLWSINRPAYHAPVYKKSVTPNNFKSSKVYFPLLSILPPTPTPWTRGLSSTLSTSSPSTDSNDTSSVMAPSGTLKKREQISGDVNIVSGDVGDISASQGITKDHSDGKFAKKSTTTAVTSKNIMNTDTRNKTSVVVPVKNHIIDDWKWMELEKEGPQKNISRNIAKEKNISLLYDFKIIDGFFIPKQKPNFYLKKGIKIKSRIPNITVKKPPASPSKTSIIKQSVSTIYQENSTEVTAEPEDVLHRDGPLEYTPTTQVLHLCHTVSLSLLKNKLVRSFV